jgi:hypothetical protein
LGTEKDLQNPKKQEVKSMVKWAKCHKRLVLFLWLLLVFPHADEAILPPVISYRKTGLQRNNLP